MNSQIKGHIIFLEPSIAARIAAGEIILNPASVIKELIENSIDANATSITIEIQEGGKKYIRVTDNGKGMNKDDLLICAKKHTTSKIKKIEDLSSISTLGFRGEALYSIANVSKLTILTRQYIDIIGSVLSINGGGEPKYTALGLPEGTTVKVENLFFNLTPRRKFLKSSSIEAGKITTIVKNLMIAHPEIAFKYLNNEKLIYKTTGDGNLMNVLKTLYSDEITSQLLPIITKNKYLSINGFISRAPYFYKNKSNIHHILNGRYIDSKIITEAILAAYKGKILSSHYPFAVINLDLPYEFADVNVHPTKANVLFANNELIRNSISNKILSVLDNDIHSNNYKELNLKVSKNTLPNKISEESINDNNIIPVLNSADSLYDKNLLHVSTSYAEVINEDPIYIQSIQKNNKIVPINKSCGLSPKQTILDKIDNIIDYKLIGNAFNTYIIFEKEDNLYFIDQHAAHERLQYDKIKNQVETNSIHIQTLLIPLIKKVNQHEFNLIQTHIKLLNKFGFEIEEFGNLTLKISGLPFGIERSIGDILIDDIIEELKKGVKELTVLEENIMRIACHNSIKSGDNLSESELNLLIKNIVKNKSPLRCPHGRPIVINISKKDLAKGFKRII